MRSFMEEELDDAELDGEEEVGAQPGASASLREQSRADVPDVRNTGSASASNSQSHEGADRMAMREDIDALSGPDVSDLVDALLGEMSAVNRHALIVRVDDDSLKLVTDVHVRSEHDRHLFAEAMLELLGAPDGVLVAVQRLTLRAVSVLGSDGRASRVQRSHDLLQVVVEHSSIAHSVVREANGDAPLGAVYDRVPERLARFDSEWPGRGRVSVRFRVVLAGDEARLFPAPD